MCNYKNKCFAINASNASTQIYVYIYIERDTSHMCIHYRRNNGPIVITDAMDCSEPSNCITRLTIKRLLAEAHNYRPVFIRN